MNEKSVEVVGLDENNNFRLEVNNLEAILMQDDIKNREVAAISIAGAFRKGKSFLLNFFLRYLNERVKNSNSISRFQFVRSM